MNIQIDESPSIEPILVDLQTASKLLAVSKDLLRQEMAAGNISAQVIGASKIVFQVSELRRYAAQRRSWEPGGVS